MLTYAGAEGPRAGILLDNTVYDIERSARAFAMGPMPRSVLEILEAGLGPLLAELHDRLLDASWAGARSPLPDGIPLARVRLLAPVPRPPKIICIGLNYRDHAEEQGAVLPRVPLLFAKAPTAVIGPGASIVIPAGSTRVDYEGELAAVIGRRLKRAGPDEAREGIFGYCCMNDVSEREIQKERVWMRAKSIDTFAPLGPWIVAADQVGDPLGLGLTTKLNSQVMQSGSTRNLIFSPAELVVFITKFITLEPGDIISTGTPSGVGVFRKPPVFMKAGDTVDVTIEGIGTLSNPVVKED
ncbi:MAG TPA: fumarylacetoacetate hydrolase family protein [bacterium]|nr:fumarylacetoacetate hydrolase family protein [bacterium]